MSFLNGDPRLTDFPALIGTDLRLIDFPHTLILGVDGYRSLLRDLEETLDATVDVPAVLKGIVEALRDERSALEDLEYHCLGLLEEHRFGNLQHQFEPLVEYVHHLGGELYRGLNAHGAYLDGQLFYQLHRARTSGLYFQRRDIFQHEAQHELDLTQQRHLRHEPLESLQRGRADEFNPLVYRLTF